MKAGAEMNEEKTVKKARPHFYIDKDAVLPETAMILFILSAVFRLIGSWGKWGSQFFVVSQIILPLLSAALFVLCIRLCGKRLFCLSAIPLLMYAAFVIIKSLGFSGILQTALCIVLFTAAAILYTGTVFGLIGTKWLLPPLFALPFVFRIYTDIRAMGDSANPVTFTDGMTEMAALCVLTALLCIGLSLKKKKDETEVKLPKIKAPVVIPPKRDGEDTPDAVGAEAQTDGGEANGQVSLPESENTESIGEG